MCLFKRRYPQTQTTIYKLRKLYSKYKIRKKCIRIAKIPSRPALEDIIMQFNDLSNDVSMALERGFRIIYLDECMITKRTNPTHVWTLPKTNVCFD